MSTKKRIKNLTIKGFKSIRDLDNLRLNSLNVLIGANGVGKSNFVDYFRMFSEIMANRLQFWTNKVAVKAVIRLFLQQPGNYTPG